MSSLYSTAKFPELNAYVFQSHRCLCCSSHHFSLKYNARVAELESEIAAINCIIKAIRKNVITLLEMSLIKNVLVLTLLS